MSSGAARHRILCIEDDPRLRRLLAEELDDAGYDVQVADSAPAGLVAFFAHAPALVLCDVRMPGVSGFDFIERLRLLDAQLFGAAFVFLTALADRDNHLRGRRLGADDYITKPVDYEILFEIVRVRLGGRTPGPPRPPLDPGLAARLQAWLGDPQEPPPDFSDQLRGRFARHAEAADAPGFSGSLDGVPLGVMIIDAGGVVHYANETAAGLLGCARAAMIGKRTSPRLVDFVRRHMASQGGANQGGANQGGANQGGANQGGATGGGVSAERIVLRRDILPVAAIARSAKGFGEPAAGRVTVLLPGVPGALPAMTDILHKLFDLTQAERLLATEIGAGANLADVAHSRGVTLATVRSQLKSVFGKMGVTRQSELVRALLTLQFATGLSEWRTNS